MRNHLKNYLIYPSIILLVIFAEIDLFAMQNNLAKNPGDYFHSFENTWEQLSNPSVNLSRKKRYAMERSAMIDLSVAAEHHHMAAVDYFMTHVPQLKTLANSILNYEVQYAVANPVFYFFLQKNYGFPTYLFSLLDAQCKDLVAANLRVATQKKNPFVHYIRALEFIEQNKLDDALASIESAIPKDCYLLRELKEKTLQLKREITLDNLKRRAEQLTILATPEAAAEYVTIVRILAASGDVIAMNNAACVLKINQHHSKYDDEYLYWLKRAADNNNREALHNLAIEYAEKDDIENALVCINKLKKISNDSQEYEDFICLLDTIYQVNNRSQTKDKPTTLSLASTRIALYPTAEEMLQHFLVEFENLSCEISHEISESLEQATTPPLHTDAVEPKGDSPRDDGEKNFALPAPACQTKKKNIKHHKKETQRAENQERPSIAEEQKVENVDYEFKQNLAVRLVKVRKTVEKILTRQLVKGKEIIKLLNVLKTAQPESIKGSHNKTGIALDENHTAKKTLIPAHHASNPYGNAEKIRQIFEKFGVTSPADLWPN